ncbi:MAG: PilZ domain-containing protein [Proteobacteria bacterium]|nr:PilZ domain-containing protein [Pseudomonadota bacterium]
MTTDERRYDVREDFWFKVKFRVMTREEYEALNRSGGAIFSPFKIESRDDIAETLAGVRKTTDIALIDYLLYMDEKLDQLLDLLSKDQRDKALVSPFYQGTGQNISGSGMKIVVDRPVESEQIIHAKFLISKFPLVILDTFGEIIRISEVEKNNQTLYLLGIRFIELSEFDRERIISYVFQKQRETIRKKKKDV